MELRQIRYFLAVIEDGTISGASEKLHVAQPAITRHIQNLEAEVGAQLLERHPRGVHPTHSGRVLAEEARRILIDLERAIEKTRFAANGTGDYLCVGFNETYSMCPILTTSFRKFREIYPEVPLRVASMNTNKQVDGILSGALDLGFFFDRNLQDVGLEADLAMIDRVCVAVPPQSELVEKETIRLSDLSDCNFVWFPRQKDPWLYDQLMAACKSSGFAPRIIQEAVNDSSLLSLVSAGLGVAFAPAEACVKAGRNVSMVVPHDLNIELRLELVSRAGNRLASVMAFRDIVVQTRNMMPQIAAQISTPAGGAWSGDAPIRHGERMAAGHWN